MWHTLNPLHSTVTSCTPLEIQTQEGLWTSREHVIFAGPYLGIVNWQPIGYTRWAATEVSRFCGVDCLPLASYNTLTQTQLQTKYKRLLKEHWKNSPFWTGLINLASKYFDPRQLRLLKLFHRSLVNRFVHYILNKIERNWLWKAPVWHRLTVKLIVKNYAKYF